MLLNHSGYIDKAEFLQLVARLVPESGILSSSDDSSDSSADADNNALQNTHLMTAWFGQDGKRWYATTLQTTNCALLDTNASHVSAWSIAVVVGDILLIKVAGLQQHCH